ncbi:MAG: hypothetical protein A2068_00635 [Ignavibacteria bacterium GWB2_35_6b]|nr:MAG: hypothetical protein A2068_00635 [Ignavibacteria bacterium GWB2_35_6b]
MQNKFEKYSSNKFLRIILIICGWIFVGLGIIGIFLPVMPTTIFLILAAACFARSSEKFYYQLLNNKYLGKYIKDYMEQRGMPLRAKIVAIIMINVVIGYSAFVAVDTLWVKILLAIIAVSLTVYLISIKTMREVR